MNLLRLDAAPAPELAQALAKFEKQFVYPLGPGRSFRIEHGDDYARFFRAMGEAACFVTERDGAILGVIGAALRPLLRPDNSERLALYLGDLKINPAVRGGRTFPILATAVREWVGDRADAAFGIVMDGTPVSPTRYTGRMGIPPFVAVAQIAVLRIPTRGVDHFVADDWVATEEHGLACYRRLSQGRFASLGGQPTVRSEVKPVWLVAPDGQACCRLEDTRRAKRLIADDGVEIISAHLSAFAYHHARYGVELIQMARRCAASLRMSSLFAAVPASATKSLVQLMPDLYPIIAPATVYGAGLPSGENWNVNTAEI